MKISGVGCCLIDYVYTDFRYENKEFRKLQSRTPGDGGMITGGLVFSEDIEEFAGEPYEALLKKLVGDQQPDVSNLGGPSVVALVHASQMVADARVTYYGGIGDDLQGTQVRKFLSKTPINPQLKIYPGEHTSSTWVFSDPTHFGGKGERSFVNTIGAAGSYRPEDIPDECYDADILLAGGTALVPRIHDGLGTIVSKARERGCFTIVGTVYDFRNQKKNPEAPWPLGGDDTYRYIDLLVTDAEEALRLTGTEDLKDAAERFISYGVKSLIITHGAQDVLVWSGGERFAPCQLRTMPVSKYIDDVLEEHPEKRKDSTGCGDNFVGGVIASLAMQLEADRDTLPDILDACAWGAASGGFTCMYHGGTYYETQQGEKREAIIPVVEAYKKQAGLL